MKLLLALWFLFLSAPALAGVVDRIVVVIDTDLVMESDVRFEEVFAGLDNAGYPFWNRERSTPVHRLIDATMLANIAGDVDLYTPSAKDLADRLGRIRSPFGTDEAWQAYLGYWGFTESRFIRLITQRMIVERYLTRNLQTAAMSLEEWTIDYEALMSQVRARFRVRHVPKQEDKP
jgi:hypothetical protein